MKGDILSKDIDGLLSPSSPPTSPHDAELINRRRTKPRPPPIVPEHTPAARRRERKLREDSLAIILDPFNVRCRQCGAVVKLSMKSAYDILHWKTHKERCTRRMRAGAMAPTKPRKPKTSSPRSPPTKALRGRKVPTDHSQKLRTTTSIAGSSPLSSPSPSPPPSLPSDFDASALLESPPLTMVPASPNPLAKAATSRRPEITASPTPVHLHKRVPSTNSTHVPSSSIHNHRNPPQTSVDRSLGRRRFEPYSPPTRRNADLMDNSPHSAHLGDEQNTDSYRTPINLQTYRQREFYPSRWQDWDWSCLVQRCGPTPPDRPDSPERQGHEEYPLHSQRPRAVERAERGGGCVQDGPSQEEQVAVYSLMMIGR